MKKLIILPIAIAAIASAEWTFNEKDLYSPDPTGYKNIPGETATVDTITGRVVYSGYENLIVEPAMRYEVTITDVELTDDGKLEVHYRREGLCRDDEVWKDVYEAVPRIRPGTEHIQCKHCGEYQVKDYIIVKDKTVYAKVIPEKTTPERIEWPE